MIIRLGPSQNTSAEYGRVEPGRRSPGTTQLCEEHQRETPQMELVFQRCFRQARLCPFCPRQARPSRRLQSRGMEINRLTPCIQRY